MQPMNLVVTHRQFIYIVTLLLIAWGTASFLSIPRSEDPLLEFTGSSLLIILPGASPQEVEKLVIDPIEEELNKLSDITDFTSSAAENIALINIQFDVHSDPDDKYQDVLSAVDNIRGSLPDNITKLDINKYTSSSVAIFQYALISPAMTYRQLTDAGEELKRKLQRIDGVEEVNLMACPRQQVNVEIAPEKLEAAGISLEQVNRVLHGANTVIPGGSIIADEQRLSVRIASEFKTIDDIGNTIVGAYGTQSIRLSDIAHISLTDADTLYRARFNGERAIFLTVAQKKGTNIFPIAQTVRKKVGVFHDALEEPLKIETVFDQSKSVDRRLNGFFFNLAQGIALVAVISILALGIGSASIIVFVILLSILSAIGLLDMFGFGLDQISIVALAIALGMLVDNAIVVVELVTRKKQEGASNNEAAVAAIHEVGGAITVSTLTTVFAFLPLVFLGSHTGQFIRGLPLTVIFALVASLLFAMTVTPLLSGSFFRPSAIKKAGIPGTLLYSFADTWYKSLLHTLLKRPKTVLLVAALLFAASLSLLPHVKMSLFPSAEKPQIYISLETPKGSSITRVDTVARNVEVFLKKHPSVVHYATNIGKGNPRIYYNMFSLWEAPNIGQILVTLDTWREAAVARIISDLRKECAAIPAAEIHIKALQQGDPVAAPVAIRVIGDNLDSIKAGADSVERIISGTPGTVNIRNPIRQSRTDIRIAIDRDKASLAGIAPASIAGAVRTAVLGYPSTIYRDEDGEEYPVIIHSGKASAPGMDEIERVSVPSITGENVPLRQVATFTFEQSPSQINHNELDRVATVLADVESGYNTAEITAQVILQLSRLKLPTDTRWEIAGEEESREKAFGGIVKALVIALIGIFALLVLQFGTISQPFIIFTAIPFAISGSIIALLVTGYSFSFTAFIGFTSLMGIVVNNSIILIDCANKLHTPGQSLADTIIAACTQRFTPIILTTVTTLLGLFPLLLTGSSLWAPLAWVITGGLAVSTLLTLFIVPALYVVYTRE